MFHLFRVRHEALAKARGRWCPCRPGEKKANVISFRGRRLPVEAPAVFSRFACFGFGMRRWPWFGDGGVTHSPHRPWSSFGRPYRTHSFCFACVGFGRRPLVSHTALCVPWTSTTCTLGAHSSRFARFGFGVRLHVLAMARDCPPELRPAVNTHVQEFGRSYVSISIETFPFLPCKSGLRGVSCCTRISCCNPLHICTCVRTK